MTSNEKLRLLRTQKKLSEKQVYTAVGMKQQTYSNKERGCRRIKPHELKLFAQCLEVPETALTDDALTNQSTPLFTMANDAKDLIIQVQQTVMVLVQEVFEIRKKLEEKEKGK